MDDPDVFAHQTLTEKYLRNFNTFLEDYSERIIHIVNDGGRPSPGVRDNNLLPPRPSENLISPLPDTEAEVESTSSPIEIVWEPIQELLSFEELLMISASSNNNSGITESSDIQKVLLVLVSLTNQLRQLHKYGWKEFVYQFVLYGDLFENTNSDKVEGNTPGQNSSSDSLINSATSEGDGHVTLSQFIPTLYKVDEFKVQAQQLLSHCIQQLSSLFKDSKPHVVTITDLHFRTMFQEIGSLLSLFIVLDEIISNQATLQQHWLKYRRMIKSVRADTNTFGTDSGQLLELEKNLARLDKHVVSGHLFSNCIEKLQMDWKQARHAGSGSGASRSNSIGGKNHVILIEQFTHELSRMSLALDKEFHDGTEPLKPIAFVGLYLVAASLFAPTFDCKRIFTRIVWENLKRIPAIPIAGTYLWIPETFIDSFQKQQQVQHRSSAANLFLTPKLLRAQVTARETYLEQKVSSMEKDVHVAQYQVLHWTLQLQQFFCCSKQLTQLSLEDLITRCNLLIRGLKLAQSLNLSYRLLINMHMLLRKSITKQTVAHLCQYMESLKLIQSTFHRYNKQICYTMFYIIQTVLHIALTHVQTVSGSLCSNGTPNGTTSSSQPVQNGVSTERDELRRDGLLVVRMLENILRGSPSPERLLVAKIAFDWAVASARYWKDSEQKLTIEAALERIVTMSEIQDKIHALCNCCDIYWHRNLLDSYFSYLYKHEADAKKLPLLTIVVQDCVDMLSEKCADEHKQEIVRNLLCEIEEYCQIQLVDKLCQDIETDLRLQSHSHLQTSQQQAQALLKVDETSPFRTGLKDYNVFLSIPTLVLNDKKISFKLIVEHYLSKNFYNLASVALHDWQSYSTMRVLAAEKYKLNVVQDHLPGHSLEQGLDILAIVRNLNKFVTEFSYNLNNQVFIQIKSPNKHLDTVNIRHLANSMRTHGPGMANTTVNSTYQFLRKKIHIFSQFLFDEQIKSRLLRDIRHFKQGRQNFESTSSTMAYSFAYDRAVKFQRGIRKLGVTPEGLSPLDQFRILITHIGNALGFVRLVRSGCLHFLAAGSRFVTDLEDIPRFNEQMEGLENVSSKNDISKDWQAALKSSVQCLSTSLTNFTSTGSTIDYFGLLAKAFAAPCRNESNGHMRNFYAIIPALTLSYVDHMRVCKEKLSKKAKGTTLFTDDGFPMGVAYLLKVLGQDTEFDSLQWFAGVGKKLLEEKKQALQTISESKNDEKLQQASTLTAKRIQDMLQEFHLLRYNLSSARIFFQKSEVI